MMRFESYHAKGDARSRKMCSLGAYNARIIQCAPVMTWRVTGMVFFFEITWRELVIILNIAAPRLILRCMPHARGKLNVTFHTRYYRGRLIMKFLKSFRMYRVKCGLIAGIKNHALPL